MICSWYGDWMSLRPEVSHLPKRSLKRTCSASSSDWRRKMRTGDFCQSPFSSSIASGSSTRSTMEACTSVAKLECRGEVRILLMVCVSLGFHLGGAYHLQVVAALFAQPRVQFGVAVHRRALEAQVAEGLLRLRQVEDLAHLGCQLVLHLRRHAMRRHQRVPGRDVEVGQALFAGGLHAGHGGHGCGGR